MHISVDGVLRTLAAISPILRVAIKTMSRLRGSLTKPPLSKFLEIWNRKERASVLRYDGQLDIRSETFSGAVDIGLHVNLGSEFPRLTTYDSNLNIDVAASINSDGSFSYGYVTFLNDQAELKGGLFNTDPEKQNETLAGAFAADTFYGTLLGQVAE